MTECRKEFLAAVEVQTLKSAQHSAMVFGYDGSVVTDCGCLI